LTERPAKPRSKISRLRTSVRQWFTGSFWDPPASNKRKRRPPSQWSMPTENTGSKTRRKSEPRTKLSQSKEIQGKADEVPVDADAVVIREGDMVTRIASKEIYDFSDN